MQKISPCLWFDDKAEEAANLYTSLFKNSKTGSVLRYDEATSAVSGKPTGSVMTVDFEIEGQTFTGLNGGPYFKLNPSVSFHVKCATLDEVDDLWNSLSDDGEILMPLDKYPFSERYGWCNDKYGLSWQVIFAGGSEIQQKITTVIMFVGGVCGRAEEAVNLYASVFGNSRLHPAQGESSVGFIARYGSGEEPDKEGTVRYASFKLSGQEFGVMDSAHKHDFAFSEALSFMVNCVDQEEVDYFWTKLTEGGEESQCGWLKDKFGLSWQIIPQEMYDLINAPDAEKSQSVMKAMLQMKKLDLDVMKQAYAQA